MLKLIESLRGRKSAYGPGPVFESWAAKQPWRFTATVYDITLSAQKFRNVYIPVVSKDRLYLNHSRCFAKQTLDVESSGFHFRMNFTELSICSKKNLNTKVSF